MKRVEAEVEISNKLGLHLRAAAGFAKLADQYASDVSVVCDDNCANGKSIIALVTLAASLGTRVQIVAEGDDAQDAVDALVGLVESRFGEDT